MVRSSRRPSSVPEISMGPVPGSRENENERRVKLLSTRTTLLSWAAVGAPRSVICSRPSSRSSKPSSRGVVWPTEKPIFSPR